ncbi:MAG: ADOP family duplicated permease [Thermoanaerobaculia bacterium]|nr:ADOP family duplicated permease [Thermoanaerobaculia bacterium]
MLRDLPFVLRSLFHRPGFAVSVILTLGLGLGANAALLSLVDAVMLRPLPYPEADALVSIVSTVRRGDAVEQRSLSYPDFQDLKASVSAFEAVAAFSDSSAIWSGRERAELLAGEWVMGDYFDTLRVHPVLGPGFSQGGDREVMIAHSLWLRSFGSDPGVLDRSLTFDGEAHQVVGVMPPGFAGLSENSSVWFRLEDQDPERWDRGSRFLSAVGRLAPDVSLAVANDQLSSVFLQLEMEYSEENTGYSAVAASLRETMVGDLTRPVTLLLAAVALLLMIACANVANLLLVHRVRQRRQVAIRLALGAAGRHILGWRVAEAAVLGLLGGGLGLLLASWGTVVLVRLSPVELPAFAAVEINGAVAGLALALALVVGGVLGLSTAFRSEMDGSPELLRQGSTAGEGRSGGARRWLLAAEVALALMVSVGSLATLASWRSMTRIDPGFDPQAAVFRVIIPDVGEREAPATQDPAREALRRQVRETAAELPGVATVALSSDTPLRGGFSATVVSAEGADPRPNEPYSGGARTYRHVVSSEYFEALQLPIVRGRSFDGVAHDSTPVAVLSGRLAATLWPEVDDPIGLRFKLGPPASQQELDAAAADPAEDPWIEVIGLVGDVRHRTLVPDPERVAEDPDLYLPLSQWPRRSLAGIVRMEEGASPSTILPVLQSRLEQVHAEMPVFRVGTLSDSFDRQTARSRFGSVLMTLFALLSLALASIGIYGVMAYRVNARVRELGIRIALGADRGRLVRSVLREGLLTAGLGLTVGGFAAWTVGRWIGLDEVLYGVDPADPLLLVPAALLLAGIAAAACSLPALRASRVDPMVVLREE